MLSSIDIVSIHHAERISSVCFHPLHVPWELSPVWHRPPTPQDVRAPAPEPGRVRGQGLRRQEVEGDQGLAQD